MSHRTIKSAGRTADSPPQPWQSWGSLARYLILCTGIVILACVYYWTITRM